MLHDGEDYAFLFLHPKPFDEPRDWGLRDDMFAHATSLKRKLDKVAGVGRRANFIVMGDLNTMGLNFAADHLGFEHIDGKPIKVIGWPKLRTEAEKLQWIESFSDHAMLFVQMIESDPHHGPLA